MALNFIVLAIAYYKNESRYILNKSEKGISIPLLFLNLPWLLLTYSVYLIYSLFSKENAIDEIGNTGISISSYPINKQQLGHYDVIVDLTAEFPRSYIDLDKYVCLPKLDGVALTNFEVDPKRFANKKVLVHCAQGHGRSAVFTALLLKELQLVENAQEGLDLVQQYRPKAKPSRSQLKQLKVLSQYQDRKPQPQPNKIP